MVQSATSNLATREFATDWLDRFSSGDPAKFEHLVEPDAYYKVGHNEYHGLEGFLEIAKYTRFLYPNGSDLQITDAIAEGNKIACQVTVKAITNAGLDYENFYAVIMILSENGLIAEQYEFPDTAYALTKFSYEGMEEALGALSD